MTKTTCHKIAIRPDTHPVYVTATELNSGLLVYKLPDNVNTEPYGDRFWRWHIGHHGGNAIAIADNEIQAIRGAVAIAAITDWHADSATVQAALLALPEKARDTMRTRLRGHRCYLAGH